MPAGFSGRRTNNLSRYYRGNYGGRPGYTATGGGGGFTRAVKTLVIANGIVFVLQVLDGVAGGGSFVANFGLRPAAVTGNFFIWQLATYIFVHGGFFHILLNMFVLWMFGGELERTWGTREFTRFFFICGIGAGISSVVVSPGSTIPIIGASGAVYGILLAYGLLFPNRLIYLYFLIPVPVKYFVIGIGVLSFISSISGTGGGVAHVAHLGGMVFGYLYLRGGRYTRSFRGIYDRWQRERLRRKFEVYYNRRQDERNKDDDDWRRWKN